MALISDSLNNLTIPSNNTFASLILLIAATLCPAIICLSFLSTSVIVKVCAIEKIVQALSLHEFNGFKTTHLRINYGFIERAHELFLSIKKVFFGWGRRLEKAPMENPRSTSRRIESKQFLLPIVFELNTIQTYRVTVYD